MPLENGVGVRLALEEMGREGDRERGREIDCQLLSPLALRAGGEKMKHWFRVVSFHLLFHKYFQAMGHQTLLMCRKAWKYLWNNR